MGKEEQWIKDLIFTGDRIIPCAESVTGYVLHQLAADGKNARYEDNEPVDPTNGDDIARAKFAVMDRIIDKRKAEMLLFQKLRDRFNSEA